jgi:hypothetical protein
VRRSRTFKPRLSEPRAEQREALRERAVPPGPAALRSATAHSGTRRTAGRTAHSGRRSPERRRPVRGSEPLAASRRNTASPRLRNRQPNRFGFAFGFRAASGAARSAAGASGSCAVRSGLRCCAKRDPQCNQAATAHSGRRSPERRRPARGSETTSCRMETRLRALPKPTAKALLRTWHVSTRDSARKTRHTVFGSGCTHGLR